MKTTTRATTLAMALALAAMGLGLAACGDDDSSDTADSGGLDAALPDSSTQADSGTEPDGGVTTGEATELTVDLHTANMWAYILSDLSTNPDYAGTDWDFSVTTAMPNPPTFLLGPGVTGVNLGNAAGFHEVTEAPETGYEDDDPDPLIGIGWQDGGSGTTGFQVTQNIYVLQLSDGTYAKVEVLSAQQGAVVVRVYRQADGSRNLATQ